jgi:hypothetical protein
MYLSRTQIEEIAVAITNDFNDFFFNDKTGRKKNAIQGTPIDQLAHDYLGLDVSFARLSSDGNLCGLTAYADTEFLLEENGQKRTIYLKQNQIVLDMSFIAPGQVRSLCGKRRFTLAHECAHQILYQMQSEEVKASCRKKYAAHTSYSLRELKTKEDWNDWQACLGGCHPYATEGNRPCHVVLCRSKVADELFGILQLQGSNGFIEYLSYVWSIKKCSRYQTERIGIC